MLLVAGCGKGPVLNDVSGAITYDGDPVPDGAVTFEPQEGQATAQGATIIGGEYKVPRDKGLLAGKYKVLITIGDGLSGAGNAGVEPSNAKAEVGLVPGKDRAPPEFNTQSNKFVEVKDGEANRFNFAIPKAKK
jgi:hypothetical protein